MISPVCDKCKKELTDFGALAFSPPHHGDCAKYHICKECWNEFLKWIGR